ncbi:MAG: hypothetical protein JWO62_1873 [Acidimicrobiaceae bacterium]|jgi:predicted lipoprotein with Yx(FWY)xxD motif|nr:hypothetical protein [Acidimicrobiaceae bacterium]
MRYHRTAIAIAAGAVALSAVGVGAATAASSSAKSPAPSSAALQGPAQAQSVSRSATVHVATSRVNGKTESILVNARDLPLYYYQRDTTKRSLVTGGLARLWPPLLSASPTENGAGGNLTVVKDANGHQVAYNGHLLYTFVEDSAGRVSGQGVESFFVATPHLKANGSSSTATATAPVTTSGGGYGY